MYSDLGAAGRRDQSAAIIQTEKVITGSLSFSLHKTAMWLISYILHSQTRAVQNGQVAATVGSESRQPGGHPKIPGVGLSAPCHHSRAFLQAYRKAWLAPLLLEWQITWVQIYILPLMSWVTLSTPLTSLGLKILICKMVVRTLTSPCVPCPKTTNPPFAWTPVSFSYNKKLLPISSIG